MKKITTPLLAIGLLMSTFSAIAQSPSADRAAEMKIAEQEFKQLESERKARVAEYSRVHNVPVKSYDADGELVVLSDVDIFGDPVFTAVYNFVGVRTIGADHLHPGGTLGLNLTGVGVDAGIWDGGYTRPDHVDLTGRVFELDGNAGNSGHGTHVGGTIIGNGTATATNRGIAYGGDLSSYDFSADTGEMFQEAQGGMLVSNHSYGLALGSPSGTNNAIFGKYDNLANTFDLITFQFPDYLPVVSAGNDRGSGYNSRDGGYDILTDRSISKNCLTVAAVDGVFTYTGPNSVNMSTFSSFGPTDDGRIKPDISAKGVGVTSTDIDTRNPNNTSYYQVRSGTSMASPMVTGGIMLLQELSNDATVLGSYLTSASMRNLLLSTTKEAGDDPGPDYAFGWGLMDVEAAAEVLLDLGNTTELQELSISAAQPSYTATYTSNQPELVISIAWTDRAGGANTSTAEDDRTPDLVNDLNLVVTDANGTQFLPWKLNPDRPRDAATRGVNNVDNIEVVQIPNPSGNYTVNVTWDGTRTGASQNYSILVNGAQPGTLGVENSLNLADSIKLFPNPATDVVNVSFAGQLSGDKINIEVYDALGKGFFQINIIMQRVLMSS